VPVTSTYALTNATMPYVVRLAEEGVHGALQSDPGFMRGLNVAAGQVTYAVVAHDQGLPHVPPEQALAQVNSGTPARRAASTR
jgi:alanine dehydrogenase